VSAVRYPAAWPAVAAEINADPRPVVSWPADSLRRFGWAGPAPVLDPLPRWLAADVLTTGDLVISGQLVRGEGSRRVQELLLSGADAHTLADAGVGWVVVAESPGETGSAARTLASLPAVYHDDDLTLYRVGGDAPGAGPSRRRISIAAHTVWLAMLAVGATAAVRKPRDSPTG
jgi:hypothetical protein